MSGDSSSATFHHFQEFIISNYQNIRSSNFEISNLQISKFQNPKVRYTGLSKILRFPDSQISKIHIFQGRPHIFLYFLKCFGDKYGVRGSRVGNIFGRSRNVLKSIAIDQESLISHLGIIEAT